ncbi:tRNA pseudouridine synthase D [Hesseltinella vesiculosa]|uniref:tRNA pseudouridine synthase D n=1 Tax=Hesseltinella vesiculosa TaxID=101127 RepID=A0A1X2GNY6_9FUNG|nr:tRNA pseudouridine synthase D [Hesseltinella vesiculosa]
MGQLSSKLKSSEETVLSKRSRSDDEQQERSEEPKRPRFDEPSISKSTDDQQPGDKLASSGAIELKVSETDVGISSYVNPNGQGFHCIFKYRIEDFLVSEVDMDGEVVHLTSFEQPVLKAKASQCGESPPSNEEFDNMMTSIFDAKVAAEFRHFLDSKDIDQVFEVKADHPSRMAFYDLLESSDLTLKSNSRDGLLAVCWPENNDDFARAVFLNFQKLGGDYLQFTVYKTGVDTMNAAHTIAKETKIPIKHFGYAGTKDARGITIQTMTINKGRPERFALAREKLEKRGIFAGDFKFVPKGLTLGDHGGNRFTVVLRDVKGASLSDIEASLTSLKRYGFLNYFGMQRFGTSSILTHEVGRQLLQKNFEEAIDLILKPRAGDNPRYALARKTWQDTKDPQATLALMPPRANVEIKVLRSFQHHPNDHRRAVRSLPRPMYTMYCHAYQSYIWNRVVSERVKRYGCDQPIVGDLVLTEPKESATKKQPRNNVGRRDPSIKKVPLVLTKENIGQYTIWDVVYPMPGTNTVYPVNDLGALYMTLMGDSFYSDFPGDYRAMMALPRDLEWTFTKYNDPTAKLFNTDLDIAQGKPEPQEMADGKHLALRMDFILGTSQYATMAIREVIRMETASQTQAKLVHSTAT